MQMKDREKISSPILALLFICGVVWITALYHTPFIFNIFTLKFVRPLSTSFMRYKALSYPFARAKHKWVSYADISNTLKDAVIIAEDDQFYKHVGFDWNAIKNAAKVNWAKKRFRRGASTITQQLAKNLYLTPIKDPIRKIREAILTLLLDSYLSKERILEIYLNEVEWGPNIYGAEAAAEHYFHKSAKHLNAEQAAFLASILPNPVKLGKRGYHLSRRGNLILSRIK